MNSFNVDKYRQALRVVHETPCDAGQFSPEEREAVIQSVMGSQELEGLYLPRQKVEELLDEVLEEPLVKLGSE